MDSKPRASSAVASSPGAIEYSVKNMAAPKSMRFLTPERGRRGRPNLI
jgi:hypothetical protein